MQCPKATVRPVVKRIRYRVSEADMGDNQRFEVQFHGQKCFIGPGDQRNGHRDIRRRPAHGQVF